MPLLQKMQEGERMHISAEVTSVTGIPQNGRQPSSRLWCLWETLGKVSRFPAPPKTDLQKGSNKGAQEQQTHILNRENRDLEGIFKFLHCTFLY